MVKPKFDPGKTPETVSECFMKFCMTTSVRGVARIFKTKSRILTFMWATVVLTFLVVSAYLIIVIIRNYYKFDVNQEQRRKIPPNVPFPDITICNLQPFRRQPEVQRGMISDVEVLVLQYFKNVSSRMDEFGKGATGSTDWDRSDAPFAHDDDDPLDIESIDSNPYYNAYDYFSMDDGTTDAPDDAIYYYDEGDVEGESLTRAPAVIDRSTLESILSTTAAIYQNVNQTMRASLGHGEKMIDHCVYTVQLDRRLITENCTIRTFRHPQYFNCFTVSRPKRKGTILELSLQLFLDDFIHLFYPDAYRVDKESQLHGIKVIVHEPNSFPNVAKKGFNVPPGMAANFYLQTTRWQKQPPPYGDCSREATRWKIKTWNGIEYRYEKEACQDQCIQEHINEKCHCVDAWLINPRNKTHSLPFCVDITADLGDLLRRVACMYDFRLRPPIACTCPSPCDRYDYGTTQTMSQWPHESFHLPLYTSVREKRNLTIDALEDIIKEKKAFVIHDHVATVFNMSQIVKSKNILMNTDSFQRNFVSMNVEKESFLVNIVEEIPQISLANLLSRVGGIMCFWLGITLITTMEIVELLYDLISLCKNKKSGKDKPDVA